MARQDVETMRGMYEALNRQDIPTVLTIIDADIEWHAPGGGNAPSGILHGAEAVGREVFAHAPRRFEEFQIEPERFIDAGDHVVAIGTFRGQGKGGQRLEAPFVHVWQTRDGKPVRLHNLVEAESWRKGWGG